MTTPVVKVIPVSTDATIKIVPFPGEIGAQGPQGEQGIQGIQGDTGPQGPAGEGVGTETSYVVTGGATIAQPTFSGDPLFTGSYVELGPVVYFHIEVDMDNITYFGDGQYYIDLPLDSKYDSVVRDGHIHDQSTGRDYGISGEVEAGSNRMYLNYTNSNGQDTSFTDKAPITLSTADHFHISGIYIQADGS